MSGAASPVGLFDDEVGEPESIGANVGSLVPSSIGDVADPLSLSRELGGFMHRQGARAAAGQFGAPMPGDALGQAIARRAIAGNAGPGAPASPVLSAEDAQKQFGIPGPNGLTFKSPVPLDVARDLNQTAQNRLALADARARRPSGTWNAIAGLGANFVANAIDPLNIAAAFLPVVGEGRYAAWMAEAGDSIAARAAIRVGVGAAQGGAGQLPLSAMRYGLSRADQSDYTAGDVLGDVAMGALLGGVLHAGIGLSGDVARRFRGSAAGAVVDAQPEAGAAAARTAIAQLVDGREVDVSPVIDSAVLSRANDDLNTWVRLTQAENEKIDAGGPVRTAPAPDAALGNARASLAALAAEESSLRTDLAATQERAIREAMDPETAARLDAVESELAGTVPKARRQALESERAMLMEGRRAKDIDLSAIEGARTQAEISGLQTALERTQGRRSEAGAVVDAILQRNAQEVATAQAADRAASATHAALIASAENRLAMLHTLAARTVRRFAGAIGAPLEAGEDREIAGRILRAAPRAGEPEQTAREIGASLGDLAKRAGKAAPGVDAAAAAQETADVTAVARARLAAATARGEEGFARTAAAATGEPTAEEQRISAAADDAAKRSNAGPAATAMPKAEAEGGEGGTEGTAAPAPRDDLDAVLAQGAKDGLLSEADRAEAQDMLEQIAAHEGVARAAATAAACLAEAAD